MDKELLLSAEVQKFIKEHETDDLNALILQRDKFPDLPLPEIADQITSRKKAKAKLPTWYNTASILFPNPISIEQASSEIAAQWKANYIGIGKSGVDLTGGFGVDSYYFARNFGSWSHIEPNTQLQRVVKHNNGVLGVNNVTYQNVKGEDFLAQIENPLDFIYLDPDRRPDTNRVVGFKASQPDVTLLLPRLRTKCSRVLIKASPMIDLNAGLNDLEAVTEVIILSVANEVKEILFHLDFTTEHELFCRCVNLRKDGIEEYKYTHGLNFKEEIEISSLSSFLYEPGSAIMKSGGQDTLAYEYKLAKLNRNTNLYSSSEYYSDFPGRAFKVLGNESYNKKAIARYHQNKQANLSTRNFIDTPDQMKKKLGLKDGGDLYLFGYRDFENKNKVAVCQRMENGAL